MKKILATFLITTLGITLLGLSPHPVQAADPTVTGLAISPTTVSLQAGQSTVFTLTATLSDGTAVNVTENAVWNPNGGGFTGIPGQRGTYTAVAQGSWLLQATYGNVTAAATIVVTHGALSQLNLLPKRADLTADGVLPIRLFGVDSNGNAWDVLDTATYSVDDPQATVSAGGFTPHTAGTWTITAILAGYQASLPVTITPGMLAKIELTPAPIPTLNPQDTTTVIAKPVDAKGNTVQKNLNWKTTNPDVATVDKQGKVTARSTGQTNLVVES
ncbi:MAG: Ig-like domain-containing protein, partial [Patescibacteria group bacterium]